MFELDSLVQTIDYMIDSPRKRHIVGGVLLSISMLFGGLALTAMTLKKESDYDE